MASVGIDEVTGEVLVGWPRTMQSIKTILHTEIGERIQRRDFGSDVPAMIDRPQALPWIQETFIKAYEALEPRRVRGRWYGEPCFAMTEIRGSFSAIGKVSFEIRGLEYPNGHLGDYSVAEARQVMVNF